jgi:hypothetical protein
VTEVQSEAIVVDVFKRSSQQFHKLVSFPPTFGRRDTSRHLLHPHDTFTLEQQTNDFVQSTLFSVSTGERGQVRQLSEFHHSGQHTFGKLPECVWLPHKRLVGAVQQLFTWPL